MTFAEQSAAWIHELQSRKRKPVAPSTLHAFNSYVRRLLPILGPNTPLADIDNGFVRDLVTKLVAEGLSAKTIAELVATTKQIVASAVDANGNCLFPRQWNNKFLDLPEIANQSQPCATSADVERCIENSRNNQERLLYALLAGSGLRISEALAIRIQGSDRQTSWFPESASIKVQSTMWRSQELVGHTKTTAGAREVELDPRLNDLIREFASTNRIQAGEFLFQSRNGTVMNLKTATDRLRKHGVKGFHAFRRFRATRLREVRISEEIIRSWLGHADQTISDRYSKLAENVELRKQLATRAGLGFKIDTTGPQAPNRTTATKRPKPATNLPKPAKETVDPYMVPYKATDDDLPLALFESTAVTEVVS